MQGRRITWLVGGIGLIAAGVAGVVRISVIGLPVAGEVLALITDLLWSASVLVLAFGIGRDGSVVARKPLGLASLTIVALWPVIASLVDPWATLQEPTESSGWSLWMYLSLIVPLTAALIAAVQIGRVALVPAPWNWAPLWVLVGQMVLWTLPQLVGMVAGPTAYVEMGGLLAALGTLRFLLGTLGLGILATVLATRPRSGTVEVFRSAPE